MSAAAGRPCSCARERPAVLSLWVRCFDGTSQTLLAWSANKKKSLSRISLPDLDVAQSKGYRGEAGWLLKPDKTVEF